MGTEASWRPRGGRCTRCHVALRAWEVRDDEVPGASSGLQWYAFMRCDLATRCCQYCLQNCYIATLSLMDAWEDYC